MTPLPPELAEPILAPIMQLQQRLRELAQEHASAELVAFERRQGMNHTLLWVSNLLERIRYAVDDLQPSRMHRYGPLSPENRDAILTAHQEMSQELTRSRAALDLPDE